MMNLFIDAQIWLSIYDFSDDNYEQFNKLYDLIENEDIKVYLPEQTVEEVKRNRENKIIKALNQFNNINIQIPNLCRGYDEYKSFQELVNRLKIMHEGFLKKIEEDIMKRTLVADQTLDKIFLKISILERTDIIMQKAYYRYHIGNPPGKDKLYGDAINWETLLNSFPVDENIFFVSSDKDYKSILNENGFNQYLLDEWESKKKSKLFYYKNLTEYLRQHIKDIELETEIQKDNLISQLGCCGSFAATHSLIYKLSRFSNWTDKQVTQLLQAASRNNQVWEIITDFDIKKFYDNILKDRINIFLEKGEFLWILNRLGYDVQI